MNKIRVRVLWLKHNTLVMVRVEVRVISGCDVNINISTGVDINHQTVM